MDAPDNQHAAPVDLAHLRRFTCGDTALEQEILSLFIGHSPQCLAALESASSPAEWIAAAHSLKGSARAVGATTVAALAAAAELAHPADLAQRERQLAALRLALEAVRNFVSALDTSIQQSAAS